jgi:sugar phosphate isomerase/epimerase
LDLLGVLQSLQEIAYQGYLSFEVLPLPNTRKAAEDAIQTARQLLSEL